MKQFLATYRSQLLTAIVTATLFVVILAVVRSCNYIPSDPTNNTAEIASLRHQLKASKDAKEALMSSYTDSMVSYHSLLADYPDTNLFNQIIAEYEQRDQDILSLDPDSSASLALYRLRNDRWYRARYDYGSLPD